MAAKINAMIQKVYGDINLFFHQEENGKYTFSSDDETLQQWCESVKKKKVSLTDIFFVVKAAKEYLKNGAPEIASRTPDYGEDYVSKLNYLCQQRWHETPVWVTLSSEPDPDFPGISNVTVQVTMPDGFVYDDVSTSAKMAKKIVAMAMIEKYFE